MVHYSISTSRPCRCNLFCFMSEHPMQTGATEQSLVLKNFCVSCVCVCVGGGGGGGGGPPGPSTGSATGWSDKSGTVLEVPGRLATIYMYMQDSVHDSVCLGCHGQDWSMALAPWQTKNTSFQESRPESSPESRSSHVT